MKRIKIWWLVRKSVFRFRGWNVSIALGVMLSSILHDWLLANCNFKTVHITVPLILNFSILALLFFSSVLLRVKMEIKNFALLKVFGATRWVMFKFITLEILTLSLAGLLVGKAVVFAHLPVKMFFVVSNQVYWFFGYIAGVIFLSFLVSVVASSVVGRIDPYLAIRK